MRQIIITLSLTPKELAVLYELSGSLLLTSDHTTAEERVTALRKLNQVVGTVLPVAVKTELDFMIDMISEAYNSSEVGKSLVTMAADTMADRFIK